MAEVMGRLGKQLVNKCLRSGKSTHGNLQSQQLSPWPSMMSKMMSTLMPKVPA